MAFLTRTDLAIFERLVNGVRDFDATEIALLHAAAQGVEAVLDSADARDEKRWREIRFGDRRLT